MGLKSIRCCLNNFLFTLRCDSAACQHISASFQELALQHEAWLSEDLASVLTFIGTTLKELEKKTQWQRRKKHPWHHLVQVEDRGFIEALCSLWDSGAKYIIQLENVTT